MTQDKILEDIKALGSLMDKRYAKYLRNWNRWANNGNRTSDIYSFTEQPLSYWYQQAEDDLGSIPTMNVLSSAIRTKVSKMSQTKVRPFFNPVNGTFKTRQVVRNAQIFFDDFFTRDEVYKKGMEAYRDAQVFDYGILWANDDLATVEHVRPWEFYCDPAEYHYGKMTRCFLHFRNYPKHYVDDMLKKAGVPLSENKMEKCTLTIYWDLADGKKYTIYNGQTFIAEKEIQYKEPPFAFVFYDTPIKGFSSVSLIDNSLPIQRMLDLLNQKIYEAASLTPANMILVPDGAGIKASQIDNKVGNVYTWKPTAAGGNISVVTPNFINPQYIETLNMYEQKIYNMEGVSQLSAQSKKPTGINSGVALQTLDNVESDRFQTELQQVIGMYIQLTHRIIDSFDDNAEILPKRYGRANVKWKDIKKEAELINIQFSAASSLSKDPETKMQQIEKLVSMKMINPSIAASLLEMPDLEGAYSITSASYDDCQKIIERAVNERDYTFYENVDLNQLSLEVSSTILRLDASDEDPEVIANLVGLFQAVKMKMDEVNEATMPPPPPPAPVPQMAPPVAPQAGGIAPV